MGSEFCRRKSAYSEKAEFSDESAFPGKSADFRKCRVAVRKKESTGKGERGRERYQYLNPYFA